MKSIKWDVLLLGTLLTIQLAGLNCSAQNLPAPQAEPSPSPSSSRSPSQSEGKDSVFSRAANAVLTNPSVHAAGIEKAGEIGAMLADQLLENTEEAQQRASEFLRRELKLDIMPDKGWENEDMFKPAGYHITAGIHEEEKSPKEKNAVSFTYPSGLGNVLMNGCWGTGYKINDPCYNAKAMTTSCMDMIDGAAFLGVGFDGRGKYSPESRRTSIVQRNCVNKGSYDEFQVPDTMNVHGIYDTSASMITFESREEYSKFLKEEAGISGSFLGFYAGVKDAWGESSLSSGQKYMALMDVDVDRYEIFMDEVKPTDLTLSFLREYMDLPTSYFAAGGPLKYLNFILRWGTHYIKSAKFGGRLEIRKIMDGEDVSSKKEFEKQMEMEYKTLFSSVGSKSSVEQGESMRKQTKTTSTSVVVQGGSQEIASILSDVYSPSFKTEFKGWLKSIPNFPKAFSFHMGAITDLVNFRADDIFPEEPLATGCEAHAASLSTEVKDGNELKYYEDTVEGRKKRFYCKFLSRQALEIGIQMRRTSLQRAIEIYMEEGAMSISNIDLKRCGERRDQMVNDSAITYVRPTWKQICKGKADLRVTFDMMDDLSSSPDNKALDIKRNMSRLVRFKAKKWHTSDQDGTFRHLYGVFGNGKSDDLSKKKLSILGLVLTYNEKQGKLILMPEDYKASRIYFPTLSEDMIGTELAQVDMPIQQRLSGELQTQGQIVALRPCQVDWSNTRRLDPTDSKGKCLHFTASTEGSIFVVFASIPKNEDTWYSVEISPLRVATYKGPTLKTHTDNVNARALGDASLYQSYFVCITESKVGALIEYGKSVGEADSGDIYLNLIDSDNPINARFYAFGNSREAAKVMDAHIIPRGLTTADCKGDTTRDLQTGLCAQNCHNDCDPLAGCKNAKDNIIPQGCQACRVAKDVQTSTCVSECPFYTSLTEDKECVPSFDALIVHKMHYGDMSIQHVSVLKELTLCLWLKIIQPWSLGRNTLNLVRYERREGDTINMFAAELKQDTDTQLVKFYFTLPGEEENENNRFSLDEIKDGNWHQVCVAWSGYSGATSYYKDGEKARFHMYYRGELAAGGTMKMGHGHQGAEVALTQLQLWDVVLPDKEIARNAETCDGGKGNVRQWYHWYGTAQQAGRFFRSPSECSPPAAQDSRTSTSV